MNEPDLFSCQTAYPVTPGARTLGTSSEAAISMRPRAKPLREQILWLLKDGLEATPDEICDLLNITVLAGRPRMSELVALGHIEKTGVTRRNISGQAAHVYKRVM